jgi:hypothetical protein
MFCDYLEIVLVVLLLPFNLKLYYFSKYFNTRVLFGNFSHLDCQSGKALPHLRSICQFGEYRGLVDCSKTLFIHSVQSESSQSVQQRPSTWWCDVRDMIVHWKVTSWKKLKYRQQSPCRMPKRFENGCLICRLWWMMSQNFLKHT